MTPPDLGSLTTWCVGVGSGGSGGGGQAHVFAHLGEARVDAARFEQCEFIPPASGPLTQPPGPY